MHRVELVAKSKSKGNAVSLEVKRLVGGLEGSREFKAQVRVGELMTQGQTDITTASIRSLGNVTLAQVLFKNTLEGALRCRLIRAFFLGSSVVSDAGTQSGVVDLVASEEFEDGKLLLTKH